MAFVYPLEHPTGVVHHVHFCARLVAPGQVAVRSYETYEAYEAQAEHSESLFDVPPSGLNDPQAWLISSAGPFAGGAPAASLPLERLQAMKWDEIKRAREAACAKPVATPHGIFDADRANITDTLALMRELEALGQQGVRTEFTRADNSKALLSTQQLAEVGVALGLQVQSAFDTARALRERIEAPDATELSVGAIEWPAA